MKCVKSLLTVVMICFLLVAAGCSSESSSSKSEDGKTTITFWHPMTDITGDAVNQVVKAFEKNIRILKSSLFILPTRVKDPTKSSCPLLRVEIPRMLPILTVLKLLRGPHRVHLKI